MSEPKKQLRVWDANGVLLNDREIIVAAMEYGFGGSQPTAAANHLRLWGYEVSHYYAKAPPRADDRAALEGKT